MASKSMYMKYISWEGMSFGIVRSMESCVETFTWLKNERNIFFSALLVLSLRICFVRSASNSTGFSLIKRSEVSASICDCDMSGWLYFRLPWVRPAVRDDGSRLSKKIHNGVKKAYMLADDERTNSSVGPNDMDVRRMYARQKYSAFIFASVDLSWCLKLGNVLHTDDDMVLLDDFVNRVITWLDDGAPQTRPSLPVFSVEVTPPTQRQYADALKRHSTGHRIIFTNTP
jgi:hypothetical protein